MQIEPAPLVQWGTEKCKSEREVRKKDETAAPLFSGAEPEMKEQKWQQLEDYPTVPLS